MSSSLTSPVRHVVRLELLGEPCLPLWSDNRLVQQQQACDMHFELEVGFVLTGRLRRCYEGVSLDLGPGEMWWCGMWEAHGWQVLDGPCRDLTIALSPSDLAELHLPEAPGFDWLLPFSVPPEQRPRPRELHGEALGLAVRNLLALRPRDDEIARLLARALTLEILLRLCDGWSASADTVAGGADSIRRGFSHLNPALRLVWEQHRTISVTEAAHSCGMGVGVFTRDFRALTGHTFPEFAQLHRLKGAARDLAGTSLPIKAIASRWGFVDASHLHRLFKKRFGTTPMHHRERARALSPLEASALLSVGAPVR